MVKVSFILPAYKRRFLKEAIDSILAQTCREFELVVVDDKSPERLYEVIKEYSWEKDNEPLSDGGKKWIVEGVSVRYYQNKENIGGRDLVAAWNHAMEYATGEWCVLASDDDVYLPGYLSEMLRLTVKYPLVDAFHCRLASINAHGDIESIGESRGEYETGAEMLYNTAVRRVPVRAPDFMFRRSALLRIGGFVSFPKAWFTDTATWIALSCENGACCSNEILFQWRCSDENISNVHKDLIDKTISGVDFLKWIESQIAATPTKSQFDAFFLAKSRRDVQRVTFGVMRYVALEAPFGVVLRAMVSSRIPLGLRLRFAKDRIRRWVHV